MKDIKDMTPIELDSYRYEHRFDEAEEIMGKEAADALRKLYDFYGKDWLYWLASLYDAKRGYNYLGIDIGENDLFIQQIATAKRTSVVMSPNSIVSEERIDMASEWREQMRYYANTRSFYPAYAKRFSTRELGSRALFFIATIAIIAILPLELKLGAIGLILMRYAIVVWSSHRVARKLGESNIALKYWIYDLFGPAIEWMLWSKKSHNTPRIWK